MRMLASGDRYEHACQRARGALSHSLDTSTLAYGREERRRGALASQVQKRHRCSSATCLPTPEWHYRDVLAKRRDEGRRGESGGDVARCLSGYPRRDLAPCLRARQTSGHAARHRSLHVTYSTPLISTCNY
jgi:hypothetical protein